MAPAMTQFESKVPAQASLFDLNVDEKDNPNVAKYSSLLDSEGGSIPYTVWLDAKGNILGSKVGDLDVSQLSQLTTQALDKTR